MILTIFIIQIGFIFYTSTLIKKIKIKSSAGQASLLLLMGIVTFLFIPVFLATFYRGLNVVSGVMPDAIQICSTILGVYAIYISASMLLKLQKQEEETESKSKK